MSTQAQMTPQEIAERIYLEYGEEARKAGKLPRILDNEIAKAGYPANDHDIRIKVVIELQTIWRS